MKVKNCECCFMPAVKDPKDSGSDKYCSYCIVNGKLIAENMSLEKFKKQSYDGMKKMGMNGMKAWFFSQLIGIAPYWKSRAKSKLGFPICWSLIKDRFNSMLRQEWLECACFCIKKSK